MPGARSPPIASIAIVMVPLTVRDPSAEFVGQGVSDGAAITSRPL